MSHIREFTAGFTSATATMNSVSLTLDAAVPAGHLLVVGCVARQSTSHSATDSKGNQYRTDLDQGITGLLTEGSLHICTVVAPLEVGDTITISFASATQRAAVVVEQFDDELSAISDATVNDNGGVSSPSPTSDPLVVPEGKIPALLVSALILQNAVRVLTPNAGWTAGSLVASTGGGSDRAVQLVWRWAEEAGSYQPGGSLNTGGQWLFASFAYSEAPASSGVQQQKIWNGSDWISQPSQVSVGGTMQQASTKVWSGSAWVEVSSRENGGV